MRFIGRQGILIKLGFFARLAGFAYSAAQRPATLTGMFWRGWLLGSLFATTLEVVDMGMVGTWGNTLGTGTEGNDEDPREKGNY